jgi:ribulose-5-phosphate 4-epimerase/fuculose-1-phosphate aldolase
MTPALLSLSQQVGQRVPDWTQGPGGNVSCKTAEGELWIKASGVRLDQVTASEGLARVRGHASKRALAALDVHDPQAEQQYAKALAEYCDPAWGRPSMETGFHLLLPGRYVLHFHSIAALLLAYEWCQQAARVRSFSDTYFVGSLVVLPPLRPGLLLGRAVGEHPGARAIILANHGVVLQGEPAVLEQWDTFERAFLLEFRYAEALQPPPDGAPTPMRIYWPDAAVFFTRLQEILVEAGQRDGEPLYVLRENGRQVDRDVCEVWDATELLYRACPKMPELPDTISRVVADLPTELFRRRQGP